MLTIEWKRRVDNWRGEIVNHVYRPLGPISLSGFVTKEQLGVKEAAQGTFEPFPAGAKWVQVRSPNLASVFRGRSKIVRA